MSSALRLTRLSPNFNKDRTMSRLEALIQRYCPDGVEYHKVKEVYTRLKGTPITAGKMKEIATPSGLVRIFAGGKTVIDANEADIPNANITRVPAVLVQSRGVIDVVYYDKPFTFKNEMWAYTNDNKTSVKYLYYVLKNNVQTFRDAASGMGSLPQISLGITEDFEIPVPPLPVQEEIVRILDSFTELQAELQAELQKRKQQYNYYCNKLFSQFSNDECVREYSLAELATFTYGYTAKAEDNGPIRYIRITDVNDRGCLNPENAKYIQATQDVVPYLLNKGDLVMARTGATYGKTLFFNEDYPAAYASFLIKISLCEKVNPRYYWHFSKSDKYWEQARRLVGGGAQPQFNTGAISQVKITLPSLYAQQKVVDILDKLDNLTTNLSTGLPAEIEKRQQQYEYYRDRLLTFRRIDA